MFESALALSAVTNRVTEYLKSFLLAQFDVPPDMRKWLFLLLSAVIGIFAAFGANVNIFRDNPFYGQIQSTIGVLITGILIGGGSNVLHQIGDLLYGWKANISAPTATLTTTTSSTPTGGTATTTSASVTGPATVAPTADPTPVSRASNSG